ncbi:Hypothetical integral membrane protein (Trep_Strep) [Xylanibacter ruminicola]|uniref:Hypothetical integral membrane protein (Trep_Strep) n=1 Tax=Xylanibacter ruminicola TaxID=839 RepID=A0A1H5SER7_XYLRU|nr:MULTISPECIES: MptD family putative ECF transporter S component [Prevotellaceae]SEF49005.1 Hypothetical integral membrane protein (Trep_Strep) [Xylanibacter ruminicola]SEW15037.1 Hypothetical integral membrane protein (Trep_Strep) [Prevotella sp. khp7]
MKTTNYRGIIGFTVLYAVTSFACAFTGFIHPWCWIVAFPALAALLGAYSYCEVAVRWRKFGVGTLLSVVLGGFLLAMGECDLTQSGLMVVAGIVSDGVRLSLGNDDIQSLRFSYPILSVGLIAWIMKLWTDTEWYIQGATEELNAAYAQGLEQLSGVWGLALAIAATAVAAYLGVRIRLRLV